MKKIILLIFLLFLPSIALAPVWPIKTRASQVRTNTSNFDNILSSTTTTTQKALDIFDNVLISSTTTDGLYLKLDCSNDPLTNSLAIADVLPALVLYETDEADPLDHWKILAANGDLWFDWVDASGMPTSYHFLRLNSEGGGIIVASSSIVLDEDNMASDSAIKLATQQSIKKYVDDNAGGVSTFLELTDTPASFDTGKYFKSWASSGTWETPAGAGDMEKADYDVNTNDIVDNSEALGGYPYTHFLDTATASTTYLTDLSTGVTTQAYSANMDTDGTDDLIDGDFGTTGLMKTDGAGSYSVIFDSSTNWTTAHGWGDHSGQGYLTSLATGTVTQAYDEDLDDLSDGTLSGSKIEDKFLRNYEDDSSNYKLTLSSLAVTNTATVGSLSSSGQVTSNGNKLIDVYDWAVVITTPTWLGTDAVLISPIRSFAVTITTITMITTGGTNFVGMIEQRAYASPHSAGTDIWSGDVTVSSTTWTTGTISDYTVPANYGLYLKPTSVSGPVKILTLRGIVSKD